jgi:hypothetical protein
MIKQDVTDAENGIDRSVIQRALVASVARWTRNCEELKTAVPGLTLYRHDKPTEPLSHFLSAFSSWQPVRTRIFMKKLPDRRGGRRSRASRIQFEIADLDNRIVSADLIRENFSVFRDVYDHLTSDEKYDLLHLLVKKIVYSEDLNADDAGKKKGKIKMDLWELPPIDPLSLSSAKSFAERNAWLPIRNFTFPLNTSPGRCAFPGK